LARVRKFPTWLRNSETENRPLNFEISAISANRFWEGGEHTRLGLYIPHSVCKCPNFQPYCPVPAIKVVNHPRFPSYNND
jgi:hypothetical protein